MSAKPILAAGLFAAAPLGAVADDAEILDATVRGGNGGYTVSVTLRHGDTGWEDYADAWRVELEDGTVLATRILTHPHVNEQPFTRSQGGVAIPTGVTRIWIRSRTTQTEWSETRFPLALGS